MKTGKLIPLSDYAHKLIEAGIALDHINFSSDQYWCPSLDWLKDFGQWIKWQRPAYTEGVFVCFQFARMAAAEADRSALRAGLTNHHSFGEALGVWNTTSHEINLCLCDDGELYAFDPQRAEDPFTIVPVRDSGFKPTKYRV